MAEDVITLGSSSEDDDDLVKMVPAPKPGLLKIGISTTPRKRVEVVHLSASKLGPKIKPKLTNETGGKDARVKVNKHNGAVSSNGEVEEIIVLSSDDEEGKNDEKPSTSKHGNKCPKDKTRSQTSTSATVNSREGTKINGTIPKDEMNDVDAKDVLHDDDELTSEVGKECFHSDAADNIERLLANLKPRLSFKDRKALKIKIWKKYERLAKEPMALHHKLSKCIDLVIQKLIENPEFNLWKLLKQLFTQFDPAILGNGETFTISFTPEEQQTLESKKEKRKMYLEDKLKEVSGIIKKMDEEDVDWDSEDEHNSSFMQRDRLIAKAVKIHDMICKIAKCSKLTGRPIQKAITLKNTTTYPEVEKAVELFVNRNGYRESPEFCDILDVVETSNIESRLHLSESDRRELAKELHKSIITRRQYFRVLDVPLAFPPECDQFEDPAETDSDLEQKLQQNTKIRKSIISVIDEFAEKQKQVEAAKAGTTNSVDDDSPAGKSDEEDNDQDEETTDEEDDAASLLENDSCFITSVEDEEDAAVEAWEEPLFDAEDEDDITSGVIGHNNGDVAISINLDTETAAVPKEIEKQDEAQDSSVESEKEKCPDLNQNDEPPPSKKTRIEPADIEPIQ